jgi:hypothetical protein
MSYFTIIAFCFTAGPFCHFFFIAILRSYILRDHNSSAVNKIYKIFIAHFSAGSACLVPVSIDISHILYPIERLYCKRPIQCLASPKILTPHPPTGRRVCTPRLWCWVRTYSLGGKGVGWHFGRRQTQLCILYICKYFVLYPPLLKRKYIP